MPDSVSWIKRLPELLSLTVFIMVFTPIFCWLVCLAESGRHLGFSRALKWPWWERVLVIVATIATMVVWQLSVKDQPVWKVEQTPPSFSEEAFLCAGPLLETALDQIQYGDIAQSHWYFMGVAGDSYADVFKSEIERIKEQFDTRFGTFGRSLMLINNACHTSGGANYL